MGVINCVVFYQYIGNGPVFNSLCSGSRLHADAVVSGINHIVDNEHLSATADVYGITVLCIPRTFYCDTVNDDIGAAGGDDVKLRGVE